MQKIVTAIVLTLVITTGLVVSAGAQCGNGLLIKFDADCFAYETSYTPATFNSANGSQLTVVGIVSFFCAPLQDLNPADPAKEYTFVFTGLTSNGTVTTPLNGGADGTLYDTSYGGGVFRFYEGAPRNAPTAGSMPANPPVGPVPGNFTDGTLILEGSLANFNTSVFRTPIGTYNTSFRADYDFTGPVGGTYYTRVQDFAANIVGGLWCAKGTANGLCDIPAGYSAHPSGKFDQIVTTVEASTWGAIKQLYR